MRVVIQRAKYATCTVDNQITGKINKGFMILVGFKEGDTGTFPFSEITDWLIFTKERRVTPDDAYLLEL